MEIQETNVPAVGIGMSHENDLSAAIARKRALMNYKKYTRTRNYGISATVLWAPAKFMIADANWASYAGSRVWAPWQLKSLIRKCMMCIA